MIVPWGENGSNAHEGEPAGGTETISLRGLTRANSNWWCNNGITAEGARRMRIGDKSMVGVRRGVLEGHLPTCGGNGMYFGRLPDHGHAVVPGARQRREEVGVNQPTRVGASSAGCREAVEKILWNPRRALRYCADFAESDYVGLAVRYRLNGRQIKNSIMLVWVLEKERGTTLSLDVLSHAPPMPLL